MRRKKPSADEIDGVIGENLRRFRTLRGMTQAELASEMGITFQQVQKYERGFNRLSASRLFKASQVLETDPSALFEGMSAGKRKILIRKTKEQTNFDKLDLHIIKVLRTIKNPDVKKKALALLKTIAKS